MIYDYQKRQQEEKDESFFSALIATILFIVILITIYLIGAILMPVWKSELVRR